MCKKVSKNVQLKTIRGLCLVWECGDKNTKSIQKIMDEIYKFSHIKGTCKNQHLDWHKECKRAPIELIKHGLAEF